jgi:hypothetical protein
MKKIRIMSMIIFVLSPLFSLWGGEIDILLDKLVDKNVLSGSEAQEIRYETQEEVKKEISLGTHRTLPLWLQNITLGGDIRVRYQKDDNKNLTYKRERFRERIRLYLNSKVNDNLFVYSGIATGENTDPRSTNQTFSENFAKRNIYLDYGYLEYFLLPTLSFSAGRIKQAIQYSNDMLWDGDINQEGFLLKIENPININLSNNIDAGVFVLKENKDKKDLYLNYISDTFNWKSDDNLKKIKFTSSYYDFVNIKGENTFSNRPSTTTHQAVNSTSGGKYIYNYRPLVVDIEISKNIEDPLTLYTLSINNLSVFSSYLINTAISGDKENKGWIFGLKLGQEKVSGPGDFQFIYSRRWLEKDSWLDTYPDSDFYGGATDVKGDRFTLSYGLARDFSIVTNYFNSKPIKNNKKEEKIIQIDIIAKF